MRTNSKIPLALDLRLLTIIVNWSRSWAESREPIEYLDKVNKCS